MTGLRAGMLAAMAAALDAPLRLEAYQRRFADDLKGAPDVRFYRGAKARDAKVRADHEQRRSKRKAQRKARKITRAQA